MPRETLTSSPPPVTDSGLALRGRAETPDCIDVAALRADTRHQERQPGTSRRMRSSSLGRRGTDYQAHVGAALPPNCDARRATWTYSGSPSTIRFWISPAPGFDVRHST